MILLSIDVTILEATPERDKQQRSQQVLLLPHPLPQQRP